MDLTRVQREYVEDVWDVAVVGTMNPMDSFMVGTYVKYYAATQAAGLVASYLVDGSEGVDAWMQASNTVFRNRTFLADIPLIGEYVSILPNPVGVAEVITEAVHHFSHVIRDMFS